MFEAVGRSNGEEVECLRCGGNGEIYELAGTISESILPCHECDETGYMTVGQVRNYTEYIEAL